MMKEYFEKYLSNTIASYANQHYFEPKSEGRITSRAYFRLYEAVRPLFEG